ncbi:von Willebrand factor D and EGF domain-containing protein-like [Ruditapes philippinarum]|uniref:von Willebrand factor D and EGF domain-containing protein-like n=1 Tax=Ruditapes philippinarum TaxID=129788 RepID=UPI00295AE932|nr:von Willebrand factor D and EGF domain-containing protein-like [Ruditapes philippinarum]
MDCDDTETVYQVEDEYERFIELSNGVAQIGWMDAFINGKQFVPPFKDKREEVFSECFHQHYHGYFLQDPMPNIYSETPVRMTLCYGENYDDYWTNNCDEIYIYARMCHGKLQFDLSYFVQWGCDDCLCLVHYNNVKVKPEIGHKIQQHEVNGKLQRVYTPFLQYRCEFEMIDGVTYRTKWYINGTFRVQMGPSSNQDELVFKEDYLSHLGPGYEVQCGVITAGANESSEALSDAFFAGLKIKDDSITLSKSGSATVDIEQTIPKGCYYTDDEEPNCEERMTFEDELSVPDMCTGKLRVQNIADVGNSFVKIKSLKKNEQWTSTTHRIMLTTADGTYDDATKFDLQVYVTDTTDHDKRRSVRSETIGAIHVTVTDNYRHRNKRCYSHVDPHMKTVDGLYYEAQREGNYTLYRNKKYQTEVQQSAQYCSPGSNSGPVCACGIAIAVGADTFIFNKCYNTIFKFDLKCNEGGLIDIDEIHPHHYKVRTPIGTIIEIALHGWSNTMNIDIYMSAKDYGNVDGLCGTFDWDRSNDLLHRDKKTISDDDNRSYRFADSWRLTDEENLFKNDKRLLTPWDTQLNGMSDQPCSRPNSITKRKCKINRRTRRETNILVQHKQIGRASASRERRSTDTFTNEKAFALCNSSIYNTPAVMEFPDYLAEEDPDIIVDQCVYDLTHGNDTGWIDAHVTNVNNVADTVLNLNPVYVANNTDKVHVFRSQICLNNCSGNGECLETGVCECTGTFRGPDCSDDIRIPPVVYGIEGNGICDITEEDDCTCFEIRSDNVFDGFMCDISKHMVYLNGTRVKIEQSIHAGYYEDIFTGECCAPESRKRRSEGINDDGPFVISYDISVSNDGAAYGEINTVFVYNTTCLTQSTSQGNIMIELKDGYCFINGMCVVRKFLSAVGCLLCDPASNLYGWTTGTCKKGDSQMTTEIIIAIAVGCTVVVVIISVLCGYRVCCKRSRRKRQIHDSSISLQTKVSSIQALPGDLPEALPGAGKTSFMYYKHKI